MIDNNLDLGLKNIHKIPAPLIVHSLVDAWLKINIHDDRQDIYLVIDSNGNVEILPSCYLCGIVLARYNGCNLIITSLFRVCNSTACLNLESHWENEFI